MSFTAGPGWPRYRPEDNPFRSGCIDALAFEPPGFDGGWAGLARRLRASGYRAAIVGPHGHGKSTLLRSLHAQGLWPANMPPTVVQVRPGKPVPELLRDPRQAPRDVLIDGYDLLPWWLRHRWRLRPGRLVVTSHRRTLLPTLLRCQTTPTLLTHLLMRLSPAVATQMSASDVAALHAAHRGNVREVFRALYDAVALPRPEQAVQ